MELLWARTRSDIFVLSDTRQWAFVRKSALTPVVNINPLFETGKEKMNSAQRIFPMDRVSNRAKLTCRAYRDAYHNDLADDLGVRMNDCRSFRP